MSDPADAEQSVREWVEAQIAPLLPATWRIIPNQRVPEVINEPTVILKHLHIQPLPEAPRAMLRNEVILTVVDNHEAEASQENALDDQVLELLHALGTIDHLTWSTADKVKVTEPYLGWDITLSVNSRKKES